MSWHRIWLQTAVYGAVGVAILTACRANPRTPTTVTVTRIIVETAVPRTILVQATAEPEIAPTYEAEPETRKDLVVCTTQEPLSLYPYASTLPIETAVSHALFENDYTTLSYDLQPQGLESIPNLTNEAARLQSVEVTAGDTVINAKGEIITLTDGVKIITMSGEETVFDGTTVNMPQIVVDFTMKQRFWADGEPVTAVDSLFSFSLDAHPDTPTSKFVTARTAGYEATGDLSVRWTGLPGFVDTGYAIRFWRPLPSHLWSQFTAADLLTAKISTRKTVGDGPFVVKEWITGDHLYLEPNKHYYRADEGLPNLDSVTFRFLADNNELIESLLIGQCDIVTPIDLALDHVPLLLAAESNNLLRPYFGTSAVYEHIDFGINSWGRYGDGRNRPDWFENPSVRQAMMMCTDRQGMMEAILYGRSKLIHSYIPNDHPLYPDDLFEWPYDIQAANSLLDEAGFLDKDGDDIREDPISNAPFRVTLSTDTNELQQQIVRYFKTNMRDCGIDILSLYVRPEEWYADGPDGPLFGRQFDLAEFAWMAEREPSCFLYASWEITGPATDTNRKTGKLFGGWDAVNETGWWDSDYDAACQAARGTLPGLPEFRDSHYEAQRIFAQQLPAIPLFLRLKVAASMPNVQNITNDATQLSLLWNLHEIDIQNSMGGYSGQ